MPEQEIDYANMPRTIEAFDDALTGQEARGAADAVNTMTVDGLRWTSW